MKSKLQRQKLIPDKTRLKAYKSKQTYENEKTKLDGTRNTLNR